MGRKSTRTLELGIKVGQPPAGCELNIESKPQSTNSSSPTVNRGEAIGMDSGVNECNRLRFILTYRPTYAIIS